MYLSQIQQQKEVLLPIWTKSLNGILAVNGEFVSVKVISVGPFEWHLDKCSSILTSQNPFLGLSRSVCLSHWLSVSLSHNKSMRRSRTERSTPAVTFPYAQTHLWMATDNDEPLFLDLNFWFNWASGRCVWRCDVVFHSWRSDVFCVLCTCRQIRWHLFSALMFQGLKWTYSSWDSMFTDFIQFTNINYSLIITIINYSEYLKKTVRN